MSHLPVIIGFGGVNPAGRSSFHHAYRRLVLERLNQRDQQETLLSLATLMGLVRSVDGQLLDSDHHVLSLNDIDTRLRQQILDNTLIRKIHPDWFDVERMVFNRPAQITPCEGAYCFTLRKRHLPNHLPENWQIRDLGQGQVEVHAPGPMDVIFNDFKAAQVRTAGQLPTGFKPGALYQSRNHPRNLQMTVYSASDAINSTGIPWAQIRDLLSADAVAVYAGNSIGQLDDYGFGGLLKSPVQGKRTTSKQMPLGYGQMPADFVNAYLLGNLGATGSSLGACATFLYNLHTGVEDIRSGRRRLVLVGGSDAPVTPEVIEGFRVMGALAEDKDLMSLDGLSSLSDDDYRRSSRPFAHNCGFTMGESSQYLVLCDDSLAVELGAQVFGSVPGVFINADGHKKSISAPGIGNYLTLGKTASLVRTILGEQALRERSFVQAHGTSTPQNRVTESHVINETARAFGIENWPVAAVKSYLGHSQGTAGGDQLSLSLGVWKYGLIPGIHTLDAVAEDVHQSHLRFEREHLEVGTEGMDAVLLNSKGFGGNNASAAVLAPHVTQAMLTRKHGQKAMDGYRERLAEVQQTALEYDQEASLGLNRPTYLFGHQVLEGEDLQISDREIRVPGYQKPISLEMENPFKDFES
ncbi:beta-ketoacyl synthase [Motiliproteus sp. SC1-56]|uniref:beta-ketoacyl synthase n=1 Tax=Motiliproteus sp. SC1-56 TaxID=2799565 RepID=UPI001A8E10A1|nr:beta-ketoacyl synthase [Motiliproteus sp. SC1-56]